jgi:hypothetical protein
VLAGESLSKNDFYGDDEGSGPVSWSASSDAVKMFEANGNASPVAWPSPAFRHGAEEIDAVRCHEVSSIVGAIAIGG